MFALLFDLIVNNSLDPLRNLIEVLNLIDNVYVTGFFAVFGGLIGGLFTFLGVIKTLNSQAKKEYPSKIVLLQDMTSEIREIITLLGSRLEEIGNTNSLTPNDVENMDVKEQFDLQDVGSFQEHYLDENGEPKTFNSFKKTLVSSSVYVDSQTYKAVKEFNQEFERNNLNLGLKKFILYLRITGEQNGITSRTSDDQVVEKSNMYINVWKLRSELENLSLVLSNRLKQYEKQIDKSF